MGCDGSYHRGCGERFFVPSASRAESSAAVNMQYAFYKRDLLWLVAVLIMALVWYLDRSAILEQIDMYHRELVTCHQRLDELQHETDQHGQTPSSRLRSQPPSS